MAWSTPKTWSAGSGVTAAELNQEVRDNLNALRSERIPGGYYAYTWTPALYVQTSGNISWSNITATGTYIKVGSIVFVNWTYYAPFLSHTTAAGGYGINGLPYNVVSGPGYVCTVELGFADGDIGQFITGTDRLMVMNHGSTSADSSYALITSHTSGQPFRLDGTGWYVAA